MSNAREFPLQPQCTPAGVCEFVQQVLQLNPPTCDPAELCAGYIKSSAEVRQSIMGRTLDSGSLFINLCLGICLATYVGRPEGPMPRVQHIPAGATDPEALEL